MNPIHIAFGVADVERSEQFYTRFLGIEPAKRRPGYVKFLADGLNLALTQREAATKTGAHYGIQVPATSDVDQHVARLRDAGLLTFEERDTDCCFALQDKVWVHDPDGNPWEIFTVKADTGAEQTAACDCTDCADGCTCDTAKSELPVIQGACC